MTPEGKVKDKVRKILKEHNVYYFMPATGGYGKSGVPDFVCCVDGVFVGIECKANGNMPTPLQSREIDLIRAAKGYAMVIREDNTDAVHQLIREIRCQR